MITLGIDCAFFIIINCIGTDIADMDTNSRSEDRFNDWDMRGPLIGTMAELVTERLRHSFFRITFD